MNASGILGRGSRVVVANYMRRNSWLSRDDLTQTAHLAALEAAQGWRANGGSSPEQREAWIVGLALSRFVAAQRCPVSLPKCKGESWQAASSTWRSSLRDLSQDGEERDNPALACVAAEQYEPLEERLDRARAMAEVRRILEAESEAARAVLLAEERSSDVARRMGVSVRDVYDATAAAMRALREALCPEAA